MCDLCFSMLNILLRPDWRTRAHNLAKKRKEFLLDLE
jgi:hypothetical protein